MHRKKQTIFEGRKEFPNFQRQNKDLGMLSNLPFQGYFSPKSKSKLVTKFGDLSDDCRKGTQEAAGIPETPEQGHLTGKYEYSFCLKPEPKNLCKSFRTENKNRLQFDQDL